MRCKVEIDLLSEANFHTLDLKLSAYNCVLKEKVQLLSKDGNTVILFGEKTSIKKMLIGLPGVDRESI